MSKSNFQDDTLLPLILIEYIIYYIFKKMYIFVFAEQLMLLQIICTYLH